MSEIISTNPTTEEEVKINGLTHPLDNYFTKDEIEETMDKLYGEEAVLHWRCLLFETLATYQNLLHRGYSPEEVLNKMGESFDQLLKTMEDN